MFSYSIVMDAEDVETVLTETAASFPSYVNSWLVQSAQMAKAEMMGQVNEGIGAANGQGIKNNIDATFTPEDSSAFVGPNKSVPYAAFLETGTRPHRPPTQPDSALAQWCEMKGLNIWAVAATIAKVGTKAHPFVEPTFNVVSGPISDLFANGVDAFLAARGLA